MLDLLQWFRIRRQQRSAQAILKSPGCAVRIRRSVSVGILFFEVLLVHIELRFLDLNHSFRSILQFKLVFKLLKLELSVLLLILY